MMSRRDLIRFTQDFESDFGMSEEFSALGRDTSAWVSLAEKKGYELSKLEAENLIASREQLSDDELENVAGGWDGGGGG